MESKVATGMRVSSQEQIPPVSLLPDSCPLNADQQLALEMRSTPSANLSSRAGTGVPKVGRLLGCRRTALFIAKVPS